MYVCMYVCMCVCTTGLDENFDACINLRRWYDHIGSRGEVQQACNKMMEAEVGVAVGGVRRANEKRLHD